MRSIYLFCMVVLVSLTAHAQVYNQKDRDALRDFLQSYDNIISLWAGEKEAYPKTETEWMASGWEDKITGVTWTNARTSRRLKTIRWENKLNLQGNLLLQGLTALEEFHVSGGALDEISIESCNALLDITVKNNLFPIDRAGLHIDNCDRLSLLSIQDNRNLPEIEVTRLRSLKAIAFSGNTFLKGGLKINFCPTLENIIVEDNRELQIVQLDNLSTLTEVYVRRNTFNRRGSYGIVMGNCVKLMYAEVDGNIYVNNLALMYMSSLTELVVRDNQFSAGYSFGVTECPLLISLIIENALGLESVNIVRGTNIPLPLLINMNGCNELSLLSVTSSAVTSLIVEKEDCPRLNRLDCMNNQLAFVELIYLTRQFQEVNYDNQSIIRKVYPGEVIDMREWGLYTDNAQTQYRTGEDLEDLPEIFTVPDDWAIEVPKIFLMRHSLLQNTYERPLRLVFEVTDRGQREIMDNDPDIQIYSVDGFLVVETTTVQTLRVYDLNGQLRIARTVQGVLQVPLEKGSFIVQVGKKSKRVVIK